MWRTEATLGDGWRGRGGAPDGGDRCPLKDGKEFSFSQTLGPADTTTGKVGVRRGRLVR